ncbi:MAG: glycosyltransferase family 87 protein [Planctomycetota bacterium]
MKDRATEIRWLAMAVAAGLLFGWINSVVQAADPEQTLRRDWCALQAAGSLLLQGRAAESYSLTFEGGYFFFHPPFVLYPCALLGAISSTWLGYGVSIAIAVLSLAGALALLRRMLPARPGVHATVAAVTVSSSPWFGVLATGQVSAALVLVLAAGFLAWQRGMPFRAGLLLALLAAKPNLGLPLFALAALSGRWRLFAGICAGTAVLLLSTLPLGTEVWLEWWAAMRRSGGTIAAHDVLLWRQPTLFAFWQTVLPARLAWIAWAAVSVVLYACLARIWGRRASGLDLPRVLSVTVLFLVSCNPHVFFYDGLLLLIPGAVWYACGDRYGGAGVHRTCGVLLALVYAAQHVSTLLLQEQSPPLVGPLVTAWLVVEVWDLGREPA